MAKRGKHHPSFQRLLLTQVPFPGPAGQLIFVGLALSCLPSVEDLWVLALSHGLELWEGLSHQRPSNWHKSSDS